MRLKEQMKANRQDSLRPFERAAQRIAGREQERQSGRACFPEGCTNLAEALVYFEAQIITKVLTLKGGQLSKAAPVLGISYQGLRYILDTRQKGIASLATPRLRRQSKKAA